MNTLNEHVLKIPTTTQVEANAASDTLLLRKREGEGGNRPPLRCPTLTSLSLLQIAFIASVIFQNIYLVSYYNKNKEKNVPKTYSGSNGTTLGPSHAATILFYLYPPELFPSFWGASSSCDHFNVQSTSMIMKNLHTMP